MRHRIHGRKLNRSPQHRVALRRNLARSLFTEFGKRGYIITTREKAKYVRPFVEKLITLGREKTLHNYRRGLKLLRDEGLVHRLFETIGPAYLERPGGYTRILRTSQRRLGDGAPLVLFGFVHDEPEAHVTAVGESAPEGREGSREE
jgi:large subunit ribosomal protein L17